MGYLENQALAKGYDIILELGLDVIKDKIKSAKDQRQIREKLDVFLSRKLQENWICTREEEIDFEGLVDYIRGNLLEEVKVRLFGEKEERNSARLRILEEATHYAQAHTKLAKKRTQNITNTVMKILKDFYRKQVPKGILYASGEIVDDICDHQNEQTKKIIEEISKSQKEITQKMSENALFSADANIQLIQAGQFDSAEQKITATLQAIGTTHPLYPYYRIGFRTIHGKDEMFSEPLVPHMPKEYQPKLELGVTATLDGKPVPQFTNYYRDYSFRHQIPFEVNVVEARQLLGDKLDPFQHDAEREIGQTHKIYPPEFPPAFPCSLIGDEKPIIKYLLLRTKKILDDGTYVVTNEEQKDLSTTFSMQMNVETGLFHIEVNSRLYGNPARLANLKIIREMLDATRIRIYMLRKDCDLASGRIPKGSYTSIFESIDEDVEFLEKIVDIENYFKIEIEIPDVLYVDDMQNMEYIVELIRGGTCKIRWSEINMEWTIDSKLRNTILSNNNNYCLEMSGIVSIDLWGHPYEIPVKRVFKNGIIKDLKRLQEKLKVLDDGDPVKITCIPAKAGDMAEDCLNLDCMDNM